MVPVVDQAADPARRTPTLLRWQLSDRAAWDGGRFAVWRGRFLDDQRRPVDVLPFRQEQVVWRELSVWDLERGTHSEVVVRTQAQGGSGVGVMPIEMKIELVGGLLRYTERRPPARAAPRHVYLCDLATQQLSQCLAPAEFAAAAADLHAVRLLLRHTRQAGLAPASCVYWLKCDRPCGSPRRSSPWPARNPSGRPAPMR